MPEPTAEKWATPADVLTLADSIGAELYASLMEASADEWRRWEYMTEAAKEKYRREAARIVAEAVTPAVERILASRTAVLRAEHAAEVEGLRRRDAAIGSYEDALTAAEVERDEALAVVERVRGLAGEWDGEGVDLIRNCYSGQDVFEGEQMVRCAESLRAALRAVQTTEAPESHHNPARPPEGERTDET